MATINTTDPKPGFVYDLGTDTWFPLQGIATTTLDALSDVIITSPTTMPTDEKTYYWDEATISWIENPTE